jgi:radical SAM superfamily enzyme YgiQ (UPF0313 family)
LSTSKNEVCSKLFGDGEALLVFPGKYKSLNPQVPLSLLCLAAALQEEGYKPRILDMRVGNWADREVGNLLFVGITSMSGLQIRYGLEFARKVRAENASIPIVWGGVHPTLLPEQTAANDYVDVVVHGEGEETIKDLAHALHSAHSLESVKGITYKSEGRIVSTPDREFINLDKLPDSLPYDLLHKERYPSLKAGRIHIQTSRGCPHRCGFCYNSLFNRGRWRAKSPRKVLREIERLTQEFPGITCIDIVDDNFFVDKERVEQICSEMIRRRIATPWRANCRFDYMSSYSKDFVNLLERSNCIELDFGAETGSKRLLSLIGKGVTPSQMVAALRNLRESAPSIEPYVFWMTGFPTETSEDLSETFRLIDELKRQNPRTQPVESYIFTPFPSPMLNLLEHDFEPPKTLENWGSIDVFHFKPPWHTEKYLSKLEAISAVMRYTFYPEKRTRELSPALRVGYRLLNKLAEFRWRHKLFKFPVELKIANAASLKLRGY